MPPDSHPDVTPGMGWGLCRFYLLLASQLAIARQQLHQLILFHEHNLASGRAEARDMRKAERGECLCASLCVCLWVGVGGWSGGGGIRCVWRDSLMSFALTRLLLAGMLSGGSTAAGGTRAATRLPHSGCCYCKHATRPHVVCCCAWCASCAVARSINTACCALKPHHVCVCLCVSLCVCPSPAPAALLQQRIAGMYFCYGAWNKWHTNIADQLTEELSALTKAGSKGPGQAGDKAGGGKGAGKESAREAQGHKGKNADAVGPQPEAGCCMRSGVARALLTAT